MPNIQICRLQVIVLKMVLGLEATDVVNWCYTEAEPDI